MNIPGWLEPFRENWEGFCESRRKMRNAPWTDRAQRLTIRKLEAFKDQGYDVGQILDESTERGWRSVFPVYGQKPEVFFRDQHGNKYRVSAEGSRIYV